MKKTTIILTALIALTACNDGQPVTETKVASASTTVPSETPAPEPMPDSATMMKNWQEYMTPGKPHQDMAMSNGKWDGEVTMWMTPGATPTKNMFTAENKMLLGGRYQQSVNKGSFDGMPFEGISTLAYDNHKKMYINTWIDNMGTGIMTMQGTWDEATKTINFKGKMVDPSTTKEVDVRETYTIVDKDHHLMQMYCAGPDGKEFKTMQIMYTRKK